MATMAQYRFSVPSRQSPSTTDNRRLNSHSPHLLSFPQNRFYPSKIPISKLHVPFAGGDDGNDGDGGNRGSDGGGRGDGDSNANSNDNFGILSLLLSGWRDRVTADSQFPFKVLMEDLVGVSACVLGDMASRPNFGLNELDFVFSTMIVGSILNFTLMYLLAPTASSLTSSLPAMFANSPQGHMFQPGAYTLMDRFGTLVYKGALFAVVGFAGGLVGTAISNGLIKVRKKMDPGFETPNKPPPTLLNALTWATHMGVSSNLRYQTLNGAEFLLGKGLPPLVFKSSVVVLRCLNNVLGGMTFVMLAKITGAQSVEKKPAKMEKNQYTFKCFLGIFSVIVFYPKRELFFCIHRCKNL